MSTKLYTFNVPVTIYAVKTVYVEAEDELEAREKLRLLDWLDSSTDVEDEDYEWGMVILDDVSPFGEEG